MTRDEFRSRYRILDQATSGPVRTCHVITRSGVVLMARFLKKSAIVAIVPILTVRVRVLRCGRGNAEPVERMGDYLDRPRVAVLAADLSGHKLRVPA